MAKNTGYSTREARFHSQRQLTNVSINSSSRGSDTLSGLQGHKVYAQCTDMHTGETPIHIK